MNFTAVPYARISAAPAATVDDSYFIMTTASAPCLSASSICLQFSAGHRSEPLGYVAADVLGLYRVALGNPDYLVLFSRDLFGRGYYRLQFPLYVMCGTG